MPAAACFFLPPPSCGPKSLRFRRLGQPRNVQQAVALPLMAAAIGASTNGSLSVRVLARLAVAFGPSGRVEAALLLTLGEPVFPGLAATSSRFPLHTTVCPVFYTASR